MAGASVALGAAIGWGAWLAHHGAAILLSGAQPLMGPLGVHVGPATAACVVFGVAAAWWLPGVMARLRWPKMLVTAAAVTAVWSVLLALVPGVHDGLIKPIIARDSYLSDVHAWHGALLAHFIDRIPVGAPGQWATHVGGHPPGALLSFWALDRVGLGAPGFAAALCIAGGAAAVPAVLVSVRVLAGDGPARALAPYLCLLPIAVWIAVSPDAYFAGIAGWGVALLAIAGNHRGWRGAIPALAGGLLLGWALLLSYGLVLIAPVAVAVVLVQRRFWPLVVAALPVALVVAGFAWGGFWWWHGLRVTEQRVHDGRAGARPYGYFVLADAAVAVIALGPAVIAGATRIRRPLGWIVGAAATAVALAAVSGLARGEVERIWLPFYPWLAVAAAGLIGRRPGGWLGAQIGVAIVVQTVIVGHW